MYEARQPSSTCTTPDEYELDLNVITGGTITGNNFAGSAGVVQPQPYDQNITAMTQCDNGVGDGGWSRSTCTGANSEASGGLGNELRGEGPADHASGGNHSGGW